MKFNPEQTKKGKDFVVKVTCAKSPLSKIAKKLVRDVNVHKLNYNQLKYIFSIVRQECGLSAIVKSKNMIELPTEIELQNFYSTINNSIHKLMFEFLEGTGLRVSEMTDLKVERIDFSSNTIFIYQGKGSKDRIALVGDKLKDKLLLYLEGKSNQYLFESNRHTKYSNRRIEQLCSQYKVKAQINKELTPHTFRHLFMTKLAEAGVSAEKRAILAGHSNPATQEIYTHLSLSNIKSEVIDVIDNYDRAN